MSFRQREPAGKVILRTLLVRLTSSLVVAAAGIWLAACSGAAPPAAAPPATPPAHVTPEGQASTPAQGSPGSQPGATIQSPAAALPLTPTPYPTPPAVASTPGAGSPGPQQGAAPTATPRAQAEGATPGAGETTSASSSPAAATVGDVQPKVLAASDKGQGGITVKATWVSPGSKEAASSELDRYLAFSLALDTHSGDLTKYDLTKLSILRDNKGKEVAAAGWQSTSDDSHHREGVLKFPKGAEQGSKYLELVLRDMGGVKERVLRWDLG